MALTPGELQRKVRQLDNDMQATYSMLADISASQKRMATRLDSLEEKVDGLDVKVDGLAIDLTTVLELMRGRG